MKTTKMKIALLFVATTLAITSCKNDPPLPDNMLSFSASEIGFETAETSKDVVVKTSRNVDKAITITIAVAESGVAYGKQYTTEPAVADGKITLTIPAGQTQAAIKVSKVAGALLDGGESLKFDITTVAGGVIIDKVKTVTLKFGAILSQGGKMTVEGKLKADDKKVEPVYIDFSRNEQRRMADMPYTLGFYCGKEFRVLLNNSGDVRATFAGETYETAKTDIAAVTLADAKKAANIGVTLMSMTESLPTSCIDNPNGKFADAVFREISANDQDNKVYFVTTGTTTPQEWYKIKVARKGATGYTVKYALVGETAIKSIDIEKRAELNLIGLDLATGKTVEREPQKEQWDILYTAGINTSAMTMGGGPAQLRPYFMQDLFFMNNLAGVEVAQVKVADIAYDKFAASDMDKVTFSSDRNIIGSNWRAGGGPGRPPKVYDDRYFVVKDPAGNHYKIRFLKMGPAEGGTRGRPEMEYALIK